jgi:SAM-dependent methyltransferase
MNELLSLYRKHHGKISDRWSSYLVQYDRILWPWREKDVRLLEIGIQNGGSLEIWGEYFRNATKLVGCDVDPLCAQLRYGDQRIAVVVADASSEEGFSQIQSHAASFDIVIDDGSHRSSHIVQAFARYFPLVAEGGLFIAEDLHCSYWDEFQGGLSYPLSSVAFFKLLVDVNNHEHWGVQVDARQLLADFEREYGCEFREADLQQVHSIEFVNSMCIVRKKSQEANLLGPRCIVGNIEEVSTGAKRYDGTVSSAPGQMANMWSGIAEIPARGIGEIGPAGALHRIRNLQSELAQSREDAADRERELQDRVAWELAQSRELQERGASELAQSREDAADRERKLQERVAWLQGRLEHLDQGPGLEQMLRAKEAEIAELTLAQTTYSARLARLLSRSGQKLFPMGGKRRSLLTKTLRASERFLRPGLRSEVMPAIAAPAPVPAVEPTHGATVQPNAGAVPADFAQWISAFEPSESELAAQSSSAPPYDAEAPLFSIILPVYKVPSGVLRATLASLTAQTWQNWEVCIAFADNLESENHRILQELASSESRIKVLALTENGGISRNSNAALAIARGEFVALLDHDDELTPWALHAMASAIARHPHSDFLYSDKDSINADGTLRQNPLFKPEWSPEMLYSVNYLTHLNVMRRSCVEQAGGWRPETDGAQDWDLFIRVAEVSREIRRVPGIGYHWRIIQGSTSTGIEAKPYAAAGQLRTLQDWVLRQSLAASVTPDGDSGFKLNWHLPADARIDVVVYGAASVDRFRSMTAVLRKELRVHLGSLSIVRVGASSGEAVLFPGDEGVREFRCESEAELSATLNQAVSGGSAPVITILDAAVRDWVPDSLWEISAWTLLHPQIGFAAPLLLESTTSVVEAGRVLGDGLKTQPLFSGTPLRHWGSLGGPLWYRNVSAASPAALSIKRSVWVDRHFPGASLTDACTALCKGVREVGLRGVMTPHARIFVARPPARVVGEYDSGFSEDPYFHPFFQSVCPLTLKDRREPA